MKQLFDIQQQADTGSGVVVPRRTSIELRGVDLRRWAALLIIRGASSATFAKAPECKVEFIDPTGTVQDFHYFNGELRDNGDALLVPEAANGNQILVGPSWSTWCNVDGKDGVTAFPDWPQINSKDQLMIARRLADIATGATLCRAVHTLSWQQIPIRGCSTVRFSWTANFTNGGIPVAVALQYIDLIQGLAVE